MTIIYSLITYCDVSEPYQIGIQDPATPYLEGMIHFHDYLVFFVILIGVAVFWLLTKIILNFNDKSNITVQKFSHSSVLEIAWTLTPAIILIFIAIPSFSLLYSLDELIDPSLTLKIVGHQWYWSYEYSDFSTSVTEGNSVNFDSYMISTEDLTNEHNVGNFRLLEVDNAVLLPIKTHIRLLVTSTDVLHSWCVPSFGLKIDACPGRLSQGALFLKRTGDYYGQCSEICGINHAFMPIVVRGVTTDHFILWMCGKIDNIKPFFEDVVQTMLNEKNLNKNNI